METGMENTAQVNAGRTEQSEILCIYQVIISGMVRGNLPRKFGILPGHFGLVRFR